MPLKRKEISSLPVALVQTARCTEGATIAKLLSRLGIDPQTIYPVETFEAAANYAIAGAGLAVLPGILATRLVRKQKLRKVHISGIPSLGFGAHRIGLISRLDRRNNPVFKKVEQELKGLLGELL